MDPGPYKNKLMIYKFTWMPQAQKNICGQDSAGQYIQTIPVCARELTWRMNGCTRGNYTVSSHALSWGSCPCSKDKFHVKCVQTPAFCRHGKPLIKNTVCDKRIFSKPVYIVRLSECVRSWWFPLQELRWRKSVHKGCLGQTKWNHLSRDLCHVHLVRNQAKRDSKSKQEHTHTTIWIQNRKHQNNMCLQFLGAKSVGGTQALVTTPKRKRKDAIEIPKKAQPQPWCICNRNTDLKRFLKPNCIFQICSPPTRRAS